MEVARREAQEEAAEGTTIIAEEQTAGRGRIRRPWLSPKGSISLSIILYPNAAYLPSLIMLTSLAVVRSIEAVAGLKPGIKWPNDVLINGKKVCGILIEGSMRGNMVDYAIMGIGINLNLKLSEFPEISQNATSLSDELGKEVPPLDIIRHLLIEVERLYLNLQSGASVYEEWRDNLVTLGRQVHVTWGGVVYEGVAESVARDGSLLLRRSDGTLTRIVVGDVTLRH
jgi:BirA family biotin operon repressor/biotin-[acetyl-CoA-carboxylase] ligase